MDFDALSTVEYGNDDALQVFLFENGLQHKLFQEVFMDSGFSVPIYPLMDAEIKNLDDWLLAHQVEHQYFDRWIHDLGKTDWFAATGENQNRQKSTYD